MGVRKEEKAMNHKRINSFSGPSAHAEARQKAKYGHHDWIRWTDKNGIRQARRLSAATMKECLLSVGTKGRWFLIHASEGSGSIGYWWMGLNILNQYKFGLR